MIRTMQNGPLTMDYGRWTMDDGPRTKSRRCGRLPCSASHGQVSESEYDRNADHDPYAAGAPVRGCAERRVQRPRAESLEREQERRRDVRQRELVAIGGVEESVRPVHRADRDEHHQDQERRADRAEQAESNQEAAD